MIGRVLLHSLAAIMLCATTANASTDPRLPYDTKTLQKTCDHYANRARFMSRVEDAPLEVLLADSCKIALSRLARHWINPYEAKRARIYLDRLTAYKKQIIMMNFESFAQLRQAKISRLPPPTFGYPSPKVSAAGEYLIARQMGVIDVYSDWARAANFETIVVVAR